ncbi:DNA gyrase subunit A [Candidatus Sumerlaeota bacterium]|nr:DNA gyrase subunit A [Candidatus Sumerlaeota bacterium]
MQDQRQQILETNIEDEMKNSFIDYAMSVIVQRALPDVRDGLKPVHRRIIYGMKGLNLVHNRPYTKCAKIVGEVLGKYHPHGDMAVYDSLVRMGQHWSLRCMLVDGQGNFGSIDGDRPAAYRYTEARMTQFAEFMLEDIEKETVDFMPNFDGQEKEPTVLPSSFPNLLVNGSTGIAVGMATNIPPHNPGEVIDAVLLLLKKPEATLKEILAKMPGPDFPTGGFICGRRGIRDAYKTGRGKLTCRARIATEQLKGGREALIVTEIPYMVNKSKLIEDIANAVRDKKIQGISEVRDESDRDGMRIMLELKRGEVPQVVINQLYKHSQLQTTFGIIMLALVDNRPRYLSLHKMLEFFIQHRRDVIVRRTRFDLDKAEARAHIVEGLLIAVRNIDDVVDIIRNSKDSDEARERLMEEFELTKIQAQAILDMRLGRLTGLEIDKLEQEYKDLQKLIKELRGILASRDKVDQIIHDELTEIRGKMKDSRRTEIVESESEVSIEDLIAEENMIITVSHAGYIKRTPTSQYRKQRRGGKGIAGMDTKDEDWVEYLFVGTTHDYMMFFTDRGRAYWLKVYELPQGGRATKGRPIVNMLEIEKGEQIQAMVPVRNFTEDNYLVMATRKGMIVRNSLSLYSNPRKTGINAIKIQEGDELIHVKQTRGDQEIILGTRKGMAIRFHETDMRPMGRHVQGVIGVNLADDDEVVGMEVCRPNATLLTVCEKGFGKRTKIEDYRLIRRGGKGVINIKNIERNGDVIAVIEVLEDEELIMITQKGVSIRCPVSNFRVIGRSTAGVRLITLQEGDAITGVARLGEKADEKINPALQDADDADDSEDGTDEEE